MNYPEELLVDERTYQINYKTAKKLSSSVKIRNGGIVLSLSRFVRGRKRDEIVENFLDWAREKLQGIEINDFVLPEYRDGGRVCTHNKVYELIVKMGDGRSRVKLNDGVIDVVLGAGQGKLKLQDMIDRAVIGDQEAYLQEVLDELNQLYFQENFNKCRWRRLKSRFGSCSSTRNISIAYKLLFAPREVFRYVCVHELAHLKEFNHSKKFWNLVAKAMPDYKNHEKWLKNNGLMLG